MTKKTTSVEERIALLTHVAIHQYAFVGEVEKDLDKVMNSLNSVEETQGRHTAMLSALNQRFATLDGRFSGLDEKFAALGQKISRHDEKFAVLDEKVSGLVEDMSRVLALLQPGLAEEVRPEGRPR